MTKSPPNHHIPRDLSLSDELIVRGSDQFGTPMYLYDKCKLEQNWRSLTDHLPNGIKVHYSVKANPSLAIVSTFARLGANFEVASIGELMAVLRTGVSPARIIFVGPGKTDLELRYAITQELRALIVESPRELHTIEDLAQSLGKRVRVALRINPGTGKGMLSMGGATQFGMGPDAALDLLQQATSLTNVDIVGVHCYLGAQILDWKVILEHSRLTLQLSDELQQRSGKPFEFVDLGGGFGVPYYETDQALDLTKLCCSLTDLVGEYRQRYPATETIAVESGRFLVGPAGMFVTRVVDIKRFREQCFVILDGGINAFGGIDRYAGSRPMPIRVLGSDADSLEALTLCGPLCTPLDRLAASVLLPMPRTGSLVVFYLAGAYGYTASPGLFLSHGFPCEVLATGEELVLIRRRTSPDDLFFNQSCA